MKGTGALLRAHFRRRLLEPEDATGERGITLFHVIALLAAPGVLLPFVLLVKTLRIAHWDLQRGELAAIAEGDRLLFVIVGMTVTGLVTLLVWDGLYPDRKDYLNLLPLPLRSRDIFFAKLAGVGEVLLGFVLAFHGVTAVIAPLLWLDRAGGGWPFRPMLAYAAAMLSSSCFVFFSLAGVQGVLQAFLPVRIFRRVNATLQAVMLSAILVLFFLRTTMDRAWEEACAHLGETGSRLPPLWFSALHETLLGRHGNPFDAWAPRALVALAVSAAVFAAGYVLAYRRFLLGTLDAPQPPARAGRRGGVVLSLLERLFRAREAAAMFRFTLRTLSRGTHHRLVLSAGAALGVALSFSAGIAAPTPGGFPDVELLAIPLTLIFCLAAALRVALARPVELRAAWAFRTAPLPDGEALRRGAAAAAALVAVAAPAALGFVVSLAFFGWRLALLQLVFDVVAGLLLVDLLVGARERVPLASPAVPGEERVHVTGFLWVLGFFAFSQGGGAFARLLLQRPALLLVSCVAALAVRAFARRGTSAEAPQFEGTTDAMPTLDLRPRS